MTVPGTQWLAHERIHPGLPAHLRNHGRALLGVGFDRGERLGVPAAAQPKLTGRPEGPDPPCLAEYRHQPVVPVEPEQHYQNGPTPSSSRREPSGTPRSTNRVSIADTHRTAHDGLVYAVVMISAESFL